MTAWIENTFGPENASMASWLLSIIGIVVLLLAIWLIIRAIRRPRYGNRKRNNKARLAVTDAASVDSRRRLVLLRRDDVEHLIMIGGPTDIVIESDIRQNAPARQREIPAEATMPRMQAAERREPAVATPTPATPPPAKPAEAPRSSSTPPVEPATRIEAKPVSAVTGTTVAAGAGVAATAVSTADTAVKTAKEASSTLAMPEITAETSTKKSAEEEMEALLSEMTPKK